MSMHQTRARHEARFLGVQYLPVADGIACGSEGVHVHDLRPAAVRKGRHRLQLQGARTGSNHRSCQREVLVLQRGHVAHHFSLEMYGVEDVLLLVRANSSGTPAINSKFWLLQPCLLLQPI